MTWAQNYDPLHNAALSTAIAAVPILLLLVLIATNKVKTYWAALIALVLTLAIAVYVFTMPADMAVKSQTESYEIVKKLIAENMEEMRDMTKRK